MFSLLSFSNQFTLIFDELKFVPSDWSLKLGFFFNEWDLVFFPPLISFPVCVFLSVLRNLVPTEGSGF